MRFLFGIVLGAALTLLVATTTNAPTNPVLQQLNGSWQQFIHNTGELLFRHQAPAPAPPPVLTTRGERLPAAPTPPTPPMPMAPADPVASAPEVAIEHDNSVDAPPATALHNFAEQLAIVEEAQADFVIESTAAPIAAPAAEAVETAEAGEAETEPFFDADIDSTINGNGHTASVWVPFHSERSASGFANRLSKHFDYPFGVARQGPGEYQVTFSYEYPEEREAMLMEIAQITGQ